jgi:hypothetical protein
VVIFDLESVLKNRKEKVFGFQCNISYTLNPMRNEALHLLLLHMLILAATLFLEPEIHSSD